jgi:hypothetical protein
MEQQYHGRFLAGLDLKLNTYFGTSDDEKASDGECRRYIFLSACLKLSLVQVGG